MKNLKRFAAVFAIALVLTLGTFAGALNARNASADYDARGLSTMPSVNNIVIRETAQGGVNGYRPATNKVVSAAAAAAWH